MEALHRLVDEETTCFRVFVFSSVLTFKPPAAAGGLFIHAVFKKLFFVTLARRFASKL